MLFVGIKNKILFNNTQMGISDYIFILVCLMMGAGFLLLSTDKVYKFYLGIIFGFLIFLVLNLEVKIIELSSTGVYLPNSSFLAKNKDFVLAFSTAMIPIFGLFSVFNDNETKSKPILSFSFGLFIPVFLLSLFSFILVKSTIKIVFLSTLLSGMKTSVIFSFFKNHTIYIYYFIIFILFWRFFVVLFFRLLSTFGKTSMEYLVKLKKIKHKPDADKK